jgi:branched-chain amino acid transport system permease protein
VTDLSDLTAVTGSDDLKKGVTPHRELWAVVGLLLFVGLVTGGFLLFGSSFSLFIYNTFLWSAVAAIALNFLMGTAGQVSIGNAAFLAVGAFSTVFFNHAGFPFPLDIISAAVVAGLVGLVFGLPALRVQGIYLALSTLAAQFIVLYVVTEYQQHTVQASGFSLPDLFASFGVDGQQRVWTLLLTATLAGTVILISVLGTGRMGRAARMVRDHEAAAPALGVRVGYTKLVIFVLTSALIGLAGGFSAYLAGTVSTDSYTLALAISFLAMILIGGLDSVTGSIIGAGLVVGLPYLTSNVSDSLFGSTNGTVWAPQISLIIYGALIVVFILASPNGIIGWLRGIRDKIAAGRGGKHEEDPLDL